jgi:hypothetical protein
LRPSLSSVSSPSFRFFSVVGQYGSLQECWGCICDGDESPPRLTEVARGKRKKTSAKKRKRTLTEAERAQAVAAEMAERGGRSSGIHIGEHRFHLEGRQLGSEATEETEDIPVDQPTEDLEETEAQGPPPSRAL